MIERRHAGGCEQDPGEQPGADGGVDELDRLQRDVCPLEQPVERVPGAEVAERLLRRPHQARGGREPLLGRPARGLALLLAEVRGDLAAEARAGRCAHQEEERRDQAEEADDRGDRGGADLVERVRQLRCLGLRDDAGAGDDRLRVGAGRLDRDPVAGPCRGDVAELPGAAQLLGERGVDRLQILRPARADVAAARLLGQPLQRRRPEARALDPDRVDGDVRIARGGDRLLEAGVARDLLAVREQDQHAGRIEVGGERLRRDDDPVVERGAADLVDLERAQGGVRLGRVRGEVRQLDRLLADRDERDPVAGGLGADELAGGRGRVLDRLADHRLRAVEEEHDALLAAEVDGAEADDRRGRSRSALGAAPTGFGVTTVARTVGYSAVSRLANFGAAAVATPGKRRAEDGDGEETPHCPPPYGAALKVGRPPGASCGRRSAAG